MTTPADIEAAQHAAVINSRYMELPSLTRQELEFAGALAATSNINAAAKRVGIPRARASIWAERPDIQQHVKAIMAPHQEVIARGVQYELADAHADIEIGKRMSATATEWFRGVELQMRLHGLDKKSEATITVNVNTREQLEQIDDDALMKMAGFSYEDLLPEAVDGEYVDV